MSLGRFLVVGVGFAVLGYGGAKFYDWIVAGAPAVGQAVADPVPPAPPVLEVGPPLTCAELLPARDAALQRASVDRQVAADHRQARALVALAFVLATDRCEG